MSRHFAVLLLSLLLAACGSDVASSTDGEVDDAGADGGAIADAGNEESDTGAATPDASSMDSGVEDAGVPEVPFQTGATVETATGTVEGEESGDLRVFKGIPYAEPPTGDRRLAAPVPKQPWDGTFEATDWGNSCPQAAVTFGDQSEDCLNLNVWAHNDDTERPVMVWIYGGGFIVGETAIGAYEGSDLAVDADVVVITINYRLGPLANLAIPELQAEDPIGAAGNMGLLDQVEALRWIKTNAPAFGGDPDNITVFGESAGAISTCALMGTPLADDLFQKAIMQSGNCALFTPLEADTPLAPSARTSSETIVEELGCADATDRLACLRALPYEDFENATDLGALVNLLGSSTSLGPTIDGVVLEKQPYERIVAGEAPERPVIAGSNGNEATLFTSTEIVLSRFDFENKVAELTGDETVAAEVVSLYSAFDYPIAKDAFNAFIGEILFNCNTYHTVQALDGDGYYYSLMLGPTVLMTPYGPIHGADIFYVFGNFVSSGIVPSFWDLDTSATVQQAWGEFARTGVPTWDGDEWPAALPGETSIMQIDLAPGVETEFRDGRCDELQRLGLLP